MKQLKLCFYLSSGATRESWGTSRASWALKKTNKQKHVDLKVLVLIVKVQQPDYKQSSVHLWKFVLFTFFF